MGEAVREEVEFHFLSHILLCLSTLQHVISVANKNKNKNKLIYEKENKLPDFYYHAFIIEKVL